MTELHYNPAPGESEFIEIQNVSGAAVPLAGVQVSGVGYTFAAGAPDLPPGEVVLLVEIDPATFRSTYNPPADVDVFGPYAGRLDNGGETVEVRLPEAAPLPADPDLLVAVDSVDYDDDAPWPTEADGDGPSLERLMPLGFGSDPASWQVSAENGGTPGVVGAAPSDWRDLYFTAAEIADPLISGPDADADGDGIGNLAEHLMGTDPRDPDSRPLFEAAVVEDGGEMYLELRHSRRNGVADFAIEYQLSDGLDSWQAAGAMMQVTDVADQGDGASIVTARSTDTIAAMGVDARFARLTFVAN